MGLGRCKCPDQFTSAAYQWNKKFLDSDPFQQYLGFLVWNSGNKLRRSQFKVPRYLVVLECLLHC